MVSVKIGFVPDLQEVQGDAGLHDSSRFEGLNDRLGFQICRSEIIVSQIYAPYYMGTYGHDQSLVKVVEINF